MLSKNQLDQLSELCADEIRRSEETLRDEMQGACPNDQPSNTQRQEVAHIEVMQALQAAMKTDETFAIVCEWEDGTVDVNGPYPTEEIAILAARHIANHSFHGTTYWTEDGAKVYPAGTTPKEMVDHTVDPDMELYVREMGDPVEKPDTEQSVGQLGHWKDEA